MVEVWWWRYLCSPPTEAGRRVCRGGAPSRCFLLESAVIAEMDEAEAHTTPLGLRPRVEAKTTAMGCSLLLQHSSFCELEVSSLLYTEALFEDGDACACWR
jgi:hypothetical protein